MNDTYSVAAGLDYIGVRPTLSHLHQTGRVRCEAATDAEVVEALRLTIRSEGLVAAPQGRSYCHEHVRPHPPEPPEPPKHLKVP